VTKWTDKSGSIVKTTPQELRDGKLGALGVVKANAAELRKELSTQRSRVEALLGDERRWPYDEWRTYYLDHPLMRAFARRLIWQFDDTPSMPVEEDAWLTLRGQVSPPAADEVRLWHPIYASVEEVSKWRDLLFELELTQPFKQAFREVYRLAPAEEQTETYSNRFAAHILDYPRHYALAKQRGWRVVALGPYDNDGGRQSRDFAEQGLRVEFWVEHVDAEQNVLANIDPLASTDQVRFTQIAEGDIVRLTDVPPVVFSEAMRDVDLFVSVASVAGDPNWIDRGPERFHAYWHEHAFGELTETAQTRRELLERILPSLRVSDRCTLSDRFLIVRGNLRTYRIHLGSANVMMEPNDEYLCIVPARGSRGGRVFVPFPEDDRLSVILSKALLLAADDKIKDPTIRRQIADRR
jgi:hypothetical protein